MLSQLTKLLKKKNDIIRQIDYSIIHLNELLFDLISKNPEITNFTWEPSIDCSNVFIYGKYPLIYVELTPFNTVIEYERLIKSANGNYNPDNINKLLLNLICNNLKNGSISDS